MMRSPIAILRACARRFALFSGGRSGGFPAAVGLALALLVASPGIRAQELPQEVQPPATASVTEQMTDAEVQSFGCAVAAAVAGVATVTAGGVALIAAEAGVGSAGAVAVPVLVATMAGACSLGNLAAPAVIWLSRKGTLLGSAVVRTVAKE